MIILVRVRGVLGRSKIPGYEKNWFMVSKADYGVRNTRSSTSEEDNQVSRGRASLQSLNITKVVDRATCDLMFEGMKGEPIDLVEIQMVENAKNGSSNHPVLMLRFEDVFLTEWKLDLSPGDASETVQFDYQRVAMEYHQSKDGFKYERIANKGWDTSLQDGQQMGAPWDYKFKVRGEVSKP